MSASLVRRGSVLLAASLAMVLTVLGACTATPRSVAAGASTAPLELLTPGSLVASPANYGSFVGKWMDRLLVVTRPVSVGAERRTATGFATEEARRALAFQATETFRSWCAVHGLRYAMRAGDFLSPGDRIHVCLDAASEQPVAGMSILEWKNEGGVLGVNFEHWYGEKLTSALASERARLERLDREARDAPTAKAEQERAAAVREKRARARSEMLDAERAKMSRGLAAPPVPDCVAFERQSNAMATRLLIGVIFDEYRKQLGDLAVAFDECGRARPSPSAERAFAQARAYRAWKLMYALWSMAESQCTVPGCGARWPTIAWQNGRSLRAIFAGYPEFDPASAEELINSLVSRVPRFAAP